jgi:UDP-glucose 4,6-dehydratase
MRSKIGIVTGGLGFIGKNVCMDLKGFYDKIIIVDSVNYASDLVFFQQHLSSFCDLVIQRVKDLKLDSYIALYDRVDILHFASESHVDNSFNNGSEFVMRNTYDTAVLLEQIKLFKSNVRLVLISTDEVYGERINVPAKEDDPLLPTNPYSASKAAADILTQTYVRCFNIDAIILRANNVYGTRQHAEKLIPKAIKYAHGARQFPIHGDGKQLRHFLHTQDLSDAISIFLTQWDDLPNKIFNIAGDDEFFISDVVLKIYRHFDLDAEHFTRLVEDRPFNDMRYWVDDSRMRSLGWTPKVDFDQMLASLCFDLSFKDELSAT